jgi:hypothetical protein
LSHRGLVWGFHVDGRLRGFVGREPEAYGGEVYAYVDKWGRGFADLREAAAWVLAHQ